MILPRLKLSLRNHKFDLNNCSFIPRKYMSDRIRTEDTGKIFERAGCLAFDTPYDGHYRYGEPPEHLVWRLLPLQYNGPWKHCASGGCRHDFVNANNEYLSFKTTKGPFDLEEFL